MIFLDNCTHKNIKPRKSRQWGFSSTLTPAHLFDVRGWRKRNFQFSKIALGTRLASAKWMKVKSQTRLMSWYWEQKPSCRKDLIKCNGHPWIMLSFNWLVIIWRGRGKGGGGGVRWSRGWKNFGRSWTRRVGCLENWPILMDIICVLSLTRELAGLRIQNFQGIVLYEHKYIWKLPNLH